MKTYRPRRIGKVASLQRAASHAAVLEERAHIARELHDTVTQSLFAASLIAEALPDLVQRAPDEALRGAEQLRRLTAGALAEMRTLLLELRPKALTERSLGQQLQLLCTSVSGQLIIPIRLEILNDAILNPQVQLAFYRVAQETLNNIVKHAGAGEVEVFLDCTAAAATLTVCDNGHGFDPANIGPGSLGLAMMQERAAMIGAELTIASEPGGGTSVTLRWQAARRPGASVRPENLLRSSARSRGEGYLTR